MSLVYSNGAPKPLYYPDGATLYLDWMNNTRFGNEPTISRNGEVLMLGPDGYQAFPANTLARIDGIGAQVAPARVNKCTNFNANPVDLTGVTKAGDAAATLTVVDDAAALAAAGLSGIGTSGKVFKFDNSAGVGTAIAAIAGVTGNVNPHTLSVWVRGSGGLLRVRLNDVNDAGANLTNDYVRRTVTLTPSSTIQQIQLWAAPGVVVYFILNQLEEGSYASPPIITSGAAVSRPGDILSASVPDFSTYGVVGFVKVNILGALTNTASKIITFAGASGNNERMFVGGAGGTQYAWGVVSGGSLVDNGSFGTMVTGEQTVVFAFGPNFRKAAIVGGAQSIASTTTKSLPITSRVSVSGRPADTNENAFAINKDLALFAGTAEKPVNQAFFDEVYAKATT